ncbi:MAG: extracellular solute-binding protein, partial [Actinomycetota bacterium]
MLVSAVALLASACDAPETGGEGPSITFNVSLAEEEQAGMQQVVEAFSQQSGIQVRLSNVASEDMPQKLQTEVDSGNNTIHLISMDNNALPALVDPGLVQPVDDIQVPAEVNPAL